MLIGLYSLNSGLSAQDIGYYNFEDFNAAHKAGVPGVYSMFQDTTGIIWFGSTNGIYRYDGTRVYEFDKQYRPLLGKTNYSFLETADGDVFIGSDYGICLYQVRTNQVKLILHLNRMFSERSRYMPVCVDEKGRLWFAVSNSGIGYLDGEKISWLNSRPEEIPELYSMVTESLYDKTTGIACISNFRGNRMAILNTRTGKLGLDSSHVTNTFKRSGQLLLRVNSAEVLSVNLNGERKSFIPPGADAIRKNSLYSKSVIINDTWMWISLLEGILPFNYRTGTFGKIFGYEGDTKSSLLRHISCLFRDKEGNVWVCSETDGIKVLNLSQSGRFRHLKDLSGTHNIIMDIESVNDSLLLVCPLISSPKLVNIHTNNHVNLLPSGSAYPLSETRISATDILLTMSDGSLYDFSCLDFSLKKLTTDPVYVTKIIVLPNTGELVLYNGSLIKCRIAEGKLSTMSTLKSPITDGNMLFDPFSRRIFLFNQQKCIEIDADAMRETGQMPPFCGSFIDYAWDRDHTLWLATRSGLFHYNSRLRLTEIFNTKSGLSNDVIYALSFDTDTSNLYMSTNLGISCLSLRDKKILNFGLSDGILESEHNGSAAARDRSGNFFFGNINGITVFNEDIRKPFHLQPFLIIQGINNLAAYKDHQPNPNLLSQIDLYPEDEVLDLKYSLLSTSAPSGITYSYSIEGLDKDFYRSQSAVSLRVTKPFPGTYTLILRGETAAGICVEKRIKLVVHAPFYLKWWFIIPGILLFHFIVFLVIRQIIRNRVQKKQKEIENERILFEQKSRIARELHDNVGAKLSMMLNTIDWFNKKKEIERHDLLEIRENTREVIQGLRDAIWVMDKTRITAEELFDKIKYYTNQFVKKTSVTLQFQEVTHKTVNLSTTQALNLFRIFQEALNNAVKYSDTDIVEISLEYPDEQSIILKIRDFGCGFDIENVLQGHGLKNMQDRATEINADFRIESRPSEGTLAEIRLKVLNNGNRKRRGQK